MQILNMTGGGSRVSKLHTLKTRNLKSRGVAGGNLVSRPSTGMLRGPGVANETSEWAKEKSGAMGKEEEGRAPGWDTGKGIAIRHPRPMDTTDSI